MAKYTAGDWSCEVHPTGARAEIVARVPAPSGKGGFRVIARTTDSAEAPANARLMAAAKDLLKACEAALELLDGAQYIQYMGDDIIRCGLFLELDELRTAIAKAREVR